MRPFPILAALAAGALLAACGGSSPPAATPTPAPVSTPPASLAVTGTVVEGLSAPWDVAVLPDGSALVTERDSARIVRVQDGVATEVRVVPGVVPDGEGGLLGLAVRDDSVYAYLTAADDNRVVRMAWDGQGLGEPEPVVTGIPKSGIHNGGRIAFGPDGMLYIATGDAAEPDLAQDPASLAGKILRVTPDGDVPQDNPTAGSPVFSLGHRNVQGLAFDDSGQLWASEFGTSSADELNVIIPGGNYGWPIHEGAAADPAYIDPVAQWSPTSLASPSGIAILDDVVYVASLRGQVLWQVPIVGDSAGEPVAAQLGDLGRLRTVIVGPDGRLWLMTSNTDGRGEPREGDDRVVVLG